MKNHFFTSCEGHLFDTMDDDWTSKPLRENYSTHYRNINNIKELKASLRAGKYVWPGGYEVFFITKDGGLLCYDCVKENFEWISFSVRNKVNDGWYITHTYHDAEYEGQEFCDHCNREVVAPLDE